MNFLEILYLYTLSGIGYVYSSSSYIIIAFSGALNYPVDISPADDVSKVYRLYIP